MTKLRTIDLFLLVLLASLVVAWILKHNQHEARLAVIEEADRTVSIWQSTCGLIKDWGNNRNREDLFEEYWNDHLFTKTIVCLDSVFINKDSLDRVYGFERRKAIVLEILHSLDCQSISDLRSLLKNYNNQRFVTDTFNYMIDSDDPWYSEFEFLVHDSIGVQ